MKKIIIILLLLISFDVYANDSAVTISGGSASIIGSVKSKIQMFSEKITLQLNKDTVQTDVLFTFLNKESYPVKLEVGFPEYRYGTTEETSLHEFKTWVNDKSTNVKILQDKKETTPDILRWYIKEIIFPPENKLTSRVTYSAPFAIHGPYSGAEYLYGTGKPWHDVIHEIEILIENKQDFWINEIGFTNKNVKFDIVYTPEAIKVLARDIKPDVLDIFYVHFGTDPKWIVERHWSSFEELWEKELAKIDNKYLAMLTDKQLRILRNTIYAAHGYIFKSEDLISYFSRMDWYKPNKKFNEAQLNKKEKLIVEMILKEDERRKKERGVIRNIYNWFIELF